MGGAVKQFLSLYSPSLERNRCMKSRQSFSRLTRPAGVWGSHALHSRITLSALPAFRKRLFSSLLKKGRCELQYLNLFYAGSTSHKDNIACPVLTFQFRNHRRQAQTSQLLFTSGSVVVAMFNCCHKVINVLTQWSPISWKRLPVVEYHGKWN